VFEILIGDVMGKGVAAALIAAAVKTTYRKVCFELLAARHGTGHPSPAEIINTLHAAMTPELIGLGTFVTLTLLRLDRAAQTLSCVNAGHAPTLLARRGEDEIHELPGDNLPLGVIESEHYTEQVTQLGVGDTLLVYSDGLSESVNLENVQYGEERIKTILSHGRHAQASPSMTLNSLRSDIHTYTQNTSGGDDRTAIVVQMRPLRGNNRGSIADRRAPEYLDLPRKLDKLAPLRQRIVAVAADQPDEFIESLTLAAFEAATNIIRHTPENLKNAVLTAILRRSAAGLELELVYEGKPFIPVGSPMPDFSGNSDGGFGLFIIENSVDRVEYDAPTLPGLASIRLVKNFAVSAPAIAD
jgi:anti-sigma regulatory factor (Ser/Thr protein kinase)